jgi:hypothetical protein
MNYTTLKEQVDKLFVHEVRGDQEAKCYFGEFLQNDDKLMDILYTSGFEIDDFYYNTAYYACDEISGYLDTVSDPNEELDLNSLEELFDRVRDDITPDVYTSDLLDWLTVNRVYYLDEHLSTAESGFWLLTQAQHQHLEEIYGMVFTLVKHLGGFK